MNQPSPQELHSKIKGLKIIAVVANFQGGAMATKVLYRSRLVTQRSSYSGEFPKKTLRENASHFSFDAY